MSSQSATVFLFEVIEPPPDHGHWLYSVPGQLIFGHRLPDDSSTWFIYQDDESFFIPALVDEAELPLFVRSVRIGEGKGRPVQVVAPLHRDGTINTSVESGYFIFDQLKELATWQNEGVNET